MTVCWARLPHFTKDDHSFGSCGFVENSYLWDTTRIPLSCNGCYRGLDGRNLVYPETSGESVGGLTANYDATVRTDTGTLLIMASCFLNIRRISTLVVAVFCI